MRRQFEQARSTHTKVVAGLVTVGSAAALCVAATPAAASATVARASFTPQTCYSGDLCLERGGRFEAYYKCRSVTNYATDIGSAYNHQTGSGSTAYFRARSGYVSFSLKAGASVDINWRNVAWFRVCT